MSRPPEPENPIEQEARKAEMAAYKAMAEGDWLDAVAFALQAALDFRRVGLFHSAVGLLGTAAGAYQRLGLPARALRVRAEVVTLARTESFPPAELALHLEGFADACLAARDLRAADEALAEAEQIYRSSCPDLRRLEGVLALRAELRGEGT